LQSNHGLPAIPSFVPRRRQTCPDTSGFFVTGLVPAVAV
jgi:hypothetical protein